MIFGRPTTLIIAALSAVQNVVFLILASQGTVIDVTIIAGINVAELAVIALIANQPPTVQPGDTINVQTPANQPNRTEIIT